MFDPSSGYHGADPSVLEKEGIWFAQKAVQHDKKEEFNLAAFHYSEAAQMLLSAVQAGSQLPGIIDKATQYMLRADALNQALISAKTKENTETQKGKLQLDLERAHFLLTEAINEFSISLSKFPEIRRYKNKFLNKI